MNSIPYNDTLLKYCRAGNHWLPATTNHFIHDKNRSDGWYPTCKVCRKAPREKLPPIPEGYKRCSNKTCHAVYPATLEFFFRNRNGKSGLGSHCKKCIIEAQRQYNDSDERHELMATYARKRRENPAVKLAISKVNRNHRLKDHEKTLAEEKARNDKNRDRINENARRRYAANREKRIASVNNRRARILEGTCTPQDIQAQRQRQKGKCYWCGKTLSNAPRTQHIDHIVPLSRGGANDPSNIVIACQTCNTSRSNRLPHEWPQGGRLL